MDFHRTNTNRNLSIYALISNLCHSYFCLNYLSVCWLNGWPFLIVILSILSIFSCRLRCFLDNAAMCSLSQVNKEKQLKMLILRQEKNCSRLNDLLNALTWISWCKIVKCTLTKVFGHIETYYILFKYFDSF